MRRLRAAAGGVPVAARWCALVAFLNAFVWSIVTPPFQVPDETSHVVYAQHLAETGNIPHDVDGDPFSAELHAVLEAERFPQVVGRPRDRPLLSEADQTAVDAVVADPADPSTGSGWIESSSQPPLYYAMEAGAYLVSPWQNLLDRLALMRLVSALLAGVTTLLTYLFLRELLVEPWTWTVGALAVAFQPLFGFISGGVHPDTLMCTAAAGLLLALARGFRRGLTPGLGVALGIAAGVGLFAKLNFQTLLPGAVLGLALLVWRAGPARATALRSAGAALGVFAVAVALYASLNVLVFDRPASGRVQGESARAAGAPDPATLAPISRAEQISYTWQVYLPKLPFMNDQFERYPLWDTFYKGTIGNFGWLDTPFDATVYTLSLVVVLPLVALCLLALWRRRQALVERWPELLTYLAIAAGLLVSIGLLGISYRRNTGFTFEQARYLLPLLPLYAAGVALAARGAGARFERPLAAVIVALAMGHGLFAQLLVISRFYG
jgi:4-amino-4-deoxy-L-arabinose transferase-like glycosyltransferase